MLFEILLFVLFGITVIHGIHRFPTKKTLLAFAAIALMMAVEENLIMLFTNDYSYHGYFLWVGNFPVCITLAWVTISYLGFILGSKYNTIIGVAAASSIDFVLEPTALMFGFWTWNTANFPFQFINYFNAPIQNAFGWLLLTSVGVVILKKLLPSFWGKQ